MQIPKAFKLADAAIPHVAAWSGAQSMDATIVVGRSVLVRNIGNGPARVRSVRVTVGYSVASGWSVPSVIAAGETARLESVEFTGSFMNRRELKDFNYRLKNDMPFTFTVEYSDISRAQRQTVMFPVVPNYYKVGGLHQDPPVMADGWARFGSSP